MPNQRQIVPAATLAAQTLAARPKTNTPVPTPTSTNTPTSTPDPRPPTPALDLTLPGAYCIPPSAPRQTGLVSRVVDGDTIEVASGNEMWVVHYIGLDAPEITAPAEWQAAQSLAYNESLVSGRTITMIQDVTNADVNGVRPRYVIVNNAFINYEILRQGFALTQEESPDLACKDSFLAAQVEAQSAVRGVWQPTPVPTFTRAPTATVTNTPGPATPTSLPPCVCSRGYTCSNFGSQGAAQSCYNYCLRSGFGPILRDNNANGRVCEGLP
jgi:micrococcal nuclease